MSETQVAQKSTTLFGKKERRLLTDPFNDNNPITVQVLGICSALAVTVAVKNALVMAVAVTLVTGFSNLIISLLRNTIPNRVRMIVQLVVIASLVSIVEMVLHAFQYDVYKQMSVYIGLIITNCILMGRLEAFAMANKPWQSLLDGIGNGVGYGAILIAVAFFRELFGKGSVFGFRVLPDWYVPNGLMLIPAAAIFLIGIIIWIQRSRNTKLVDIS
ncbi:MAG: NADH:ubiquinone reductase (Na(+)-transporting) subunit D [Chitinophagales bacterium]|nr:NADH:ubiquinone reductase (Na(+)-transporting) subunit D [Chitinophagales bacterium]HAE14732.1 NADH:ubiquinone reductase (Na(+)-transporting) subunit D [Bacteroidota bacterium]MCB9020559.1 NADH:ubiquinone reductase (Na(+)-transporting) subunit D [Chitinophagales bacterium]HPR28471.1 NADH:ubiquinone reductase (Na(+)-transporting) subunit D [Chitinophagales bacterium]HQU39047.1 NADH:ubiquinone reductase (Na(+)-transporting) subunit D [Chitinophagales bacterium]